MRGADVQQSGLFSYVSVEERVPANHPLRGVRALLDEALQSMHRDFERVYAEGGRASIPPERLVRALTLQILYSIRSERLLCEQLDYNLLFRWFVGLGVDDPVWDATVFTKNRDRLLDAEVAAKFLGAVLAHREVKPLLSNDHFSVDGTLVEAWASLKSFRAKDGSDEPPGSGRNGERNFHNETRTNETHASTTDPDAKLYRKSSNTAAKLSYIGHALTENRHGLIVEADATRASSRAEREAALAMIERHDPGSERQLTLGADKGYDTRGFVAACRELRVTPHVAAKVKHSAIDGRTTRHAAYTKSQRKRKLIEEAFGWAKTIAGVAKVKVRGLARVRHCFTLAMTAYNLIRMPKLLGWAAA